MADVEMVETPKGRYIVEEAENGFIVYGTAGQGATTVTRISNGYVVKTPTQTITVYTDGSTSDPSMKLEPFSLDK